jgi:hypothetical protein
VLLVLIIPFFILLTNNGTLENEQSFCPFKMMTGFPCPGCGITKSLVYLYEGNLLKSIAFHLFGPVVLVLSFYFLVKLSLELYYKKPFFVNTFNKKKWTYVFVALLIVYHLVRIVLFIKNNSWNSILKESIWR